MLCLFIHFTLPLLLVTLWKNKITSSQNGLITDLIALWYLNRISRSSTKHLLKYIFCDLVQVKEAFKFKYLRGKLPQKKDAPTLMYMFIHFRDHCFLCLCEFFKLKALEEMVDQIWIARTMLAPSLMYAASGVLLNVNDEVILMKGGD